MTLQKASLKEDFEALFSEPPDTAAACAEEWGTILKDYFSSVVPPSTTVIAASATLQTSLTSLFSTSLNASTTASSMELAFSALGLTVGQGMAPAYTSTGPAGSVGFLGLFSGAETSHSGAADKFANAIHNWAITATATQTVSPFTTVNWS